jgi:SAM-dependent methyltransferase
MFPQLYHTHHSRFTQDLHFWIELAAQSADSLLELGCGTGRVLIPLAQAGYRCIGIDHDQAMLNFLQANLHPMLNPAPLLIQADISRFKLGVQFSLIIIPCNTLSTLDEQQRRSCLECTRRHMRKGGIFTASLPNPEILMRLSLKSIRELEDEFNHPQTGNPVQVSSSWRREKHTFTLTWTYDHLFPDGRVERLNVDTVHYLVSAEQYLDDFRQAGFKINAVYGDYDRSAYTSGSPSLIILAGTDLY